MKPDELRKFLTENVDPLEDPNNGKRYRAACYLTDGTYLPCVVLQSKRARLEFALRRFKQCRWKRKQYQMVVEAFVAGGSHVTDYDLKAVELSRFAWPLTTLNAIHGETSMGWTAFVAEMRDKTMYSYGTDFRMEFFDLPDGYSYGDILRIHSGMVYSDKRGLEKYSFEAMKETPTFRDKPFFTCYVKEL